MGTASSTRMKFDYDLVVVGSGSAGLTAARFAAELGARVLLVEKRKVLGGDCTCAPLTLFVKKTSPRREWMRAVQGVDCGRARGERADRQESRSDAWLKWRFDESNRRFKSGSAHR